MEKKKSNRLAQGRPLRIRLSRSCSEPSSTSNDRVSALLDHMSDAFVVFDREWRYTYINGAAAELLQRSPQELLGKQVWTEVFPQEVGGLAYRNLHQAMAEQVPVAWEEFGESVQRWLEVKAYPNPDGITLYFRDITERKQAEVTLRQANQGLEEQVAQYIAELERTNTALREEQEKLKAIFNGALNPILLADDEGRYLDANPAACELFGVSKEELLNSRISDYAQSGIDTDAIWQHFQTDGKLTGEFPIQRLDGTVRDVKFTAIANILPHIHLAILGDITERNQAEGALFQTNNMLQSLVQNSPDLFYVKDREGRYLAINPVAANWLERTPEEILGKTDFELFPQEFASQYWQNDQNLMQTGDIAFYEEPCPCQGEIRFLQTAKYLWQDLQGNILGAIGVSRDITEFKRTQIQLQLQAQILSQVGDAVIAIDNNQCITYCNPVAEALYDFQAREMVGQPLTSLYSYNWLSPEDEQAAFQCLAESGHWRGENIHIKRNGEAIPVESTVSVLTDESGRQTGLLAIIRDIRDRKQMEADLQQSQAQLHQQLAELESIYQSAPIGLSILDTELRFVRINQRLAEINGVSVQDHIGRTIRDVLPKLADEAEKFLKPILITGEPRLNIEIIGETPAQPGVQRTWLEHFLPLKDGNRIIGINIVCEEITERKQAELALKETLQRLDLHFETTPLAVVEWDRNLRIIRWSKAAEKIFGWSAEEVLGHHMNDLNIIYEEDAANVAEVSQRLLRDKEQQLVNTNRNYTKDGRVLYCEWYNSTLLDEQGNVTSIFSFVLDVTDRTLAETEVRQGRERLRILYDATRDLLSSTNPLNLIQVLFQKMQSELHLDVYLNYVVSDSDKGLHLVSSSGIPDSVIQKIEWLTSGDSVCETVIKERSQLSFSDVQNTSEGLLTLVRSLGLTAYSCQPLIAQGKLYGTLSFGSRRQTHFTPEETGLMQALCDQIAIALDRASLIQSLQQQTKDLQEANRIKDEFLAILSHELRSPLNPILGWASLLQTRKFDPDRVAQGLTTISNNAKLLTQLIDDLLDMARILRGKLTLQMAPVGLPNIIGAALETVRLSAEAKGITITVSTDSAIPPIMGDTTRLQQVMWNLLSNAIKFTPAGGKVEVEVSLVSRHLSLVESGGNAFEATGAAGFKSIERSQESGSNACKATGVARFKSIERSNQTLVFSNGQQPSSLADQKSGLSQSQMTIDQGQTTNFAQITVTDTGKGIPADFLPHIFESFRQEDGSLTRKYGGLGLGLSISRQIVEMHGGTIWAESPGEGQGATFTILLPLPSSHLPRSTVPASLKETVAETLLASPGALAGVSILLVDDDPATRDYVKTALENEQAIVTAVDSGQRALEVLEQMQPAVLLCDIAMPEMDGYALIQAIRQLPAPVSQTPAIALTAYAGDQARQQALEAGFQQHLAKPIEPDQIVTAILQLLQTQRA